MVCVSHTENAAGSAPWTVAYDKFQEIIGANRADSPIRLQQIILGPAGQHQKLATVVSQSSVLDQIGGGSLESSSSTITGSATPSSPPVFTTEAEKTIAKIAYDVIQSFEKLPNSNQLLQTEIQKEIAARDEDRAVGFRRILSLPLPRPKISI